MMKITIILITIMFLNFDVMAQKNIRELGVLSELELVDVINDNFRGKKIIKDKKNYYIIDSIGNSISKYNSYGNYITQIGRSGNGPGEYILPTKMIVNDSNILVSEFNGQIEYYSIDSSYLQTINLPIMLLTAISYINDDIVLFSGKMLKDEDENLLHLFSIKEKKVIKSFFPIPLDNENHSNIFYNIGNTVQSVATKQYIFSFFTPLNKLYKFDLEGNFLSVAEVNLELFQPILENTTVNSPQSTMDYLKSFSRVTTVGLLANNQLALQFIRYNKLQPGRPIETEDYTLSFAIIDEHGNVLHEIDKSPKLIMSEFDELKSQIYFVDEYEFGETQKMITLTILNSL